MNADTLMFMAGAVLSLLFSYVPKLESWYKSLDSVAMRLWMLLLVFVVAVGYFALTCSRLIEASDVFCTQEGAKAMIRYFFEALIANQITYMVSPQIKRKKA